jgi:valyl-tRNA synthetase
VPAEDEGSRPSRGPAVVVAAWPAQDAARTYSSDAAAEAEVGALQELVTEVRRFRADQGLRPGQRVAARLAGLAGSPLAAQEAQVRSLARLEAAGDGFTPSASLLVGDVTVELDLSGAIDVAAERKRLEKDLAAARKEREQAQAKLGNEQFLAKAPEAVVDKIRGRLSGADADIARLEGQLAALPPA